MKSAKGTVFRYGDNVDTDVIIPARYLNSTDAKELAKHCMEDIDKEFVSFHATVDNHYVLFQPSASVQAYSDDTQSYLNYVQVQTPYFNSGEVALKRNLLLTVNTNVESVVTDLIEDTWQIANSQFSNMILARVAIDGVKYRQIHNEYIFIKDGDTE